MAAERKPDGTLATALRIAGVFVAGWFAGALAGALATGADGTALSGVSASQLGLCLLGGLALLLASRPRKDRDDA